jgi:RNA polymerase sigma-70 factor (ECF subfamily)
MLITADVLMATLSEVESVIVNRFRRKLSMVAPRFDVEDLLQTVAMKAHMAMDSCKAQTEEELRHWVLTIARNTVESVVTANRSCQKRATLREKCAIGTTDEEGRDGYQPAASLEDPAVQVEVKEQTAMLLVAIEKLPVLQARSVRLRYIEQMEYEEIASELGCSVQAVRSLVSRGLAGTRNILRV